MKNNKNKHQTTFFLKGIITLIFAISCFQPVLASDFLMLNNGSSFNEKVTNSPNGDLGDITRINLTDTSGSNLELQIPKVISSPDLYKAEGVIFLFSFKTENYLTGEKYIINNSADQNYGTLKTKPGIRFLSGSTIKLIEPDSGTFLDPDDKISLNLRSTGTENRISLDTKNTTLTAGDTDLDWEESDNENILEALKINLKISITLNNGKNVVATIIGDKNGFNFDSGLTTNSELNTTNPVTNNSGDSAQNPDQTPTETSIQTTPLDGDELYLERELSSDFQETTLDGYGLRAPGKSAYQSMSDQKNLVQWIVAITNFSLNFVTYIAMLMLLYGGYLWITSAGEEGNAEKAKKIIAGSVIGILLIISAYTIVSTVISYDDSYPEDYCQANAHLSGNPEFEIRCRVGNTEIQADSSGLGGILGTLF